MAKSQEQGDTRSNLPDPSARKLAPRPDKAKRGNDPGEPTSPKIVPSEGTFDKLFGPPKKIERSKF